MSPEFLELSRAGGFGPWNPGSDIRKSELYECE